MVFVTAGGAVVFDHRFHSSLTDCVDCHHNVEAEELASASAEDMSCRSCHYFNRDDEEKPEGDKPHVRWIGSACVTCHAERNEDLAECSVCHMAEGEAFRQTAHRVEPLPRVFSFVVDGGEAKVGGRGNVVFDHTRHAKEFDCEACHHDDRGWPVAGVNEDSNSCRACHYSDSMEKMTSGDEHHARFIGTACVGCHRETLSKDRLGCSSCHLSPEREQSRLALGTVQPMPRERILMEVDERNAEGVKQANVVFDHPFHAGSFACSECHHADRDTVQGLPQGSMNCRTCHFSDLMSDVKSDDEHHARFVGASCLGCHKKILSSEASRCALCHVSPEEEDDYLAQPPRKPMPRERMVLEVEKRGNVVFDHRYHAASFDCTDCHHYAAVEIEGVDPFTQRCRDCHYDDTMIDLSSPDSTNHKRFIGYGCVKCHTEMLPRKMRSCSVCHLNPQREEEKMAKVSAPPLPRGNLVMDIAPERLMGGVRGSVVFDHNYHAEAFTCAECHHEVEAMPGAEADAGEKRCRGCHYSVAMKNVKNIESSTHLRFVGASCVRCHRDILDRQKRACWNCHLTKEQVAGRLKSEPLKKMPERVTFRQDSEKGKKRGDVEFNHQFHMESFTCDACHHPLSGGKGTITDASQRNCRACHYSDAMAGVESPDSFHVRFVGANCRGCHKDTGKAKSGCSVCHIDPEEEPRPVVEREKLPGTISIAMTSETGKKYGDVTFDHKFHYGSDAGIACSTCHHEFKGGEGMEALEDESNCRKCHYSSAMGEVKSTDALHPRFVGANCRECHKEMESQEMRRCDTCHTKAVE